MSLDISALYELHRKELVNHLLRIVKCPETAQDLVQESYMILARTADKAAVEHPRAKSEKGSYMVRLLLQGAFATRHAYRFTQEIDMPNQQIQSPFQQVHREKIGAARHPKPPIIRHIILQRGRMPAG